MIGKDGIGPSKVKKSHWVTKISYNGKATDITPMEVTYDVKSKVDGKWEYKRDSRRYSAVINTTTLGALQKIDLTELPLPYGMKTAIRVLRYDSSTKVGIKFKTMWWMNSDIVDKPITLGGVAKTDISLRMWYVVSWG
jgi:monoamine oxidase